MSSISNHLLCLLPALEQQRLLTAGTPVSLCPGQVLHQPGESAGKLYFPEQGSVRLLMPGLGRPGLAVGLIGAEGMVGLHWALGGISTPWHAQVQSRGMAWQLSQEPFRRLLARLPVLRRVIDHYLAVRLEQLSNAVLCMRHHPIGPRLARWLLMSDDSAGSDHFELTHEDLAIVLGVRRVGVTEAAGRLQRSGLIHYHRGYVKVINRTGLEACACSCYAADQTGYAAQLGPADPPGSASGAKKRGQATPGAVGKPL